MSGRLAELGTRITTVQKLAAVIAAMRGVAAARALEARSHLPGIRTFAETIGAAIAQALTLLPPMSPDRPTPATGRAVVIVFAAEQGFAGAFNERVFDMARPLLAAPHLLLLVGSRGLAGADERGIDVDWSAPMIAHPAQVPGLAARITEAVEARLAQGGVTRVHVVHAAPDGPTGEIVSRALVPFDYSRFSGTCAGIAPRINLVPEELLARLAEDYVFAEIAEAVTLSFAAENEARMRAMIAAHDNVADTLAELVAQSRRLRQDEITDEIGELATANLAVR